MAIDLVLLLGRILLVVLLYLFLWFAMRTGIGLVRGQRRDVAIWAVDVEKGSKHERHHGEWPPHRPACYPA